MKQIIKLLGAFLLLLSTAPPVFSHGTVIYPPSRIYNCYTNSTAVCDPCGEAIYNWMGVLQPDTNYGNHQTFVPDGQIASGGNGSAVDFSCLDALTTDWPTTKVNHGYIDVKWKNTAPHTTEYYKVYLTPLNWDPTKPLRWNELIEIGHKGQGPAESSATIRSFIPDSYAGKRAALVSVWQRDYRHSHEAFYSVSDIMVEGNGGGDCTTGDVVGVTFANNTDCALQYYQNNALQGSANSGATYAVNTTIGSQWETRDNSGSQVGTFTIACDQTVYTSTGACNGGGDCTTGDTVSVTFTNSTNCSLQYYQNNALQGSADAGSFYTSSTTVGSQWSVREASGEQVSSFTITCDQNTYNSTGNCNDTGGGGCDGLDAWSSNTAYVISNQVEYNGVKYEAKWWSRGKNPEQFSGPWDAWKNIGSCVASKAGDAEKLNFIVYPNPAQDIITLAINNVQTSSSQISIKDMNGRTLETMTLTVPNGITKVNQTIRLNNLSTGVYFIHVATGKDAFTQKFFVK